MYNIILGKGLSALNVSWCKGHANQEHIDKGVSTPLLKIGNDKADENATKGVEEHVEGLLQLACFYATKQGQYIKFVQRIHAMFLRVLHAEQELLDAEEKAHKAMETTQEGAGKDKVCIPAVQSCPGLKEGHMICMNKIDASSLKGSMAKSYKAVWHFLALTQWKPTTEGRNGSSWVEMFARFYSMGGDPSVREQRASIIRPEDSFKIQLSSFVRLCRHIISIYAKVGDQALFKPARSPAKRLAHYGIDRHVPCISAELCLDGEARKRAHEQMARLATVLNKTKLRDLHEGLLVVNKTRLKLRGAPPWDNANPKPDLNKIVDRIEGNRDLAAEERQKIRPTTFLLSCHKCGTYRDCAKTHLIKQAGWTTLYCAKCELSRKALKWLCPFALPWHTCTLHRSL